MTDRPSGSTIEPISPERPAGTEAKASARITSYNVCYTKLLRISGDEAATAEELEADGSVFGAMRLYFANDLHAVYAYLLFILIYFPCFAALGAIRNNFV